MKASSTASGAVSWRGVLVAAAASINIPAQPYSGGGGYLTHGNQQVASPGGTGGFTSAYGGMSFTPFAGPPTGGSLLQTVMALVQQYNKSTVAPAHFQLPTPTVAPNLNGFDSLGRRVPLEAAARNIAFDSIYTEDTYPERLEYERRATHSPRRSFGDDDSDDSFVVTTNPPQKTDQRRVQFRS